MNEKTVLLAMGNRNPELANRMAERYAEQGYRVHRDDSAGREDISAFYRDLEKDGGAVGGCVYFPEPLFTASLFDADFCDRMEGSVAGDLLNGTWWIQQTSDHMRRNGAGGYITVLNHVASIVPTRRYSYCGVAEAALVNVGKVAALDNSATAADIRINFITCGWRESDPETGAWVEELKILHKTDTAPIIKYVTDLEIVEACLAAGQLRGMNGSSLMVDKGFSISRTIKQMGE
ncbi:MAG: SDR family oxidoreductase [Planctomycetota bacterium]|jgi:enoyl-[acyl-carrier-protein] reductase (NADH)|nr:SDR family oxidoreductase [Planctomycetota bacterium]